MDVRSDDLAFGQFNLRLGILNNLEINAAIDAYDLNQTRDYTAGATVRAGGSSDVVIGGKLNFWGNDGGNDIWASALAIQPQFKIPTAGIGVGNGQFEFSVAVPFLMNLPAGFHLGLQSQISEDRNSTNTGYTTGLQNSIAVDRLVAGNLDAYVEYAAAITAEKHTKAVQILAVGGSYPLADNILLDVCVNFGLNNASTDIEVLMGISVRF